jgi:hypothetical protein
MSNCNESVTQPPSCGPVSNQPLAPEFFRLPSRGHDPHFGLSRRFYYTLESDGLIRMVRMRRPGTKRPVLLVPYAAVSAMLNKRKQPTTEASANAADLPTLMTRPEVAKFLRCSTRSVFDLGLPTAKLGRLVRYKRDDVLLFIEKNTSTL